MESIVRDLVLLLLLLLPLLLAELSELPLLLLLPPTATRMLTGYGWDFRAKDTAADWLHVIYSISYIESKALFIEMKCKFAVFLFQFAVRRVGVVERVECFNGRF